MMFVTMSFVLVHKGLYISAPVDAILCFSAKAGSTSTHKWLNDVSWNTTGRKPNCSVVGGMFPIFSPTKRLYDACWGGGRLKFEAASTTVYTHRVTHSTLQLAIVRDPIARAVSAFMSKVACKKEYPRCTMDDGTRHKMVPDLLKMAGLSDPEQRCLTFTGYLDALRAFKREAGSLTKMTNTHFATQTTHGVCNLTRPDLQLAFLETLSTDPHSPIQLLYNRLRVDGELPPPIGHSHATVKSAKCVVPVPSEQQIHLLRWLYAEDYEALESRRAVHEQ